LNKHYKTTKLDRAIPIGGSNRNRRNRHDRDVERLRSESMAMNVLNVYIHKET